MYSTLTVMRETPQLKSMTPIIIIIVYNWYETGRGSKSGSLLYYFWTENSRNSGMSLSLRFRFFDSEQLKSRITDPKRRLSWNWVPGRVSPTRCVHSTEGWGDISIRLASRVKYIVGQATYYES